MVYRSTDRTERSSAFVTVSVEVQRLETVLEAWTAMETLARFGQTSTHLLQTYYIQGSEQLPARQTHHDRHCYQRDRDIAFTLIDFRRIDVVQYLSFWWERIFSRLRMASVADARFRQQRQWRMVRAVRRRYKDVSQTSFAIMVDVWPAVFSSGTPIAFRASVSCCSPMAVSGCLHAVLLFRWFQPDDDDLLIRFAKRHNAQG